jgi:hypothetical protein
MNGVLTPRGGRTPGARNLITRRIIEDFTEAWQRDGSAALRVLAKEDPGKFAQLGLAILPRDILISVEQRAPGGLEAEDWALMLRVLDIIKACVPADAAGPGEVFGVIENGLRMHYAKSIEESRGEVSG